MSEITAESATVTEPVLHPSSSEEQSCGRRGGGGGSGGGGGDGHAGHFRCHVSIFLLCFKASMIVAACLQLHNIKASVSFFFRSEDEYTDLLLNADLQQKQQL